MKWAILCATLSAFSLFAADTAVKPKASAKVVLPPNPKKLAPPPGVPVPPEVKAELSAGVAALGKEIDSLHTALRDKPQFSELLPDVQLFHNAVRYALADDIFYSTGQFAAARTLLKEGLERAAQLRQGQAPWASSTGLVVRGYVSRIDGSVQPYGLVVPAGYEPSGTPHRLDFWFHGRGDTLSEIAFLEARQKSAGEFTPPHTLVLHPYGRFCNAARFAGEVDALEALEQVRKHYAIDPNRIVVRGFSMGGASAWHLGVHHAWRWAAVNPGAGFVDVKNYQRLTDKLAEIPCYEQKLWTLYDPLACAVNLANTTLVAYSGEIDAQKAAADLMAQALAKEGLAMNHIIGLNTGHKYEPSAKLKVAALVDAAAHEGRRQLPPRVRFVTYTLKFNRMHWIVLDALEHHWEKAEVNAELQSGNRVVITAANVTALTLLLDPSQYAVTINGQALVLAPSKLAMDGTIHLAKNGAHWQFTRAPGDSPLAKRHDLQGPIDDAFMDSFLVVRPTGQPLNPALGAWVQAELGDAVFQWHRQFRGEARVKDDTAITDDDIRAHNLILWGDPSSNRVLAKLADKLPIRWSAKAIHLGSKTYDAATQVPALIYPNPLNPRRYVVLNSGFTFPQFGTASNAQQSPKLPDWAILELAVPVAERVGGAGVAAAGFFGENWELRE